MTKPHHLNRNTEVMKTMAAAGVAEFLIEDVRGDSDGYVLNVWADPPLPPAYQNLLAKRLPSYKITFRHKIWGPQERVSSQLAFDQGPIKTLPEPEELDLDSLKFQNFNRLVLTTDEEYEEYEKLKKRDQADSAVSHPPHYNSGKIEVIEFVEDQKLNFSRGNAVKYIARAGKKDPAKEIQDLEKAAWYINREVELLKATKENRDAKRPNDMVKK